MGKALSRLSSIISLIGVFPIKRKFGLVGVFICGNDVAIKDADRTVQYIPSDRFFIADAKYRGHVNRAEPDLLMST